MINHLTANRRLIYSLQVQSDLEMPKSKTIFIVLSIILLAILITHINEYIFKCDDAFISFRYAKNLASGIGLVFNAGEKVEGYTNFLWVIILSLFSLIGIAPEQMALILSIAISMGLLGIFIYFNRRWFSSGDADLFVYIAPLFLVLNRTYAVWSTGGLETALFAMIIFGAIAFLIEPLKNNRHLRWSALLFSLAALTRPEGILLFGSFFGYYFLISKKDRNAVRPILKSSLLFIAIIGLHFIFRLIYYGYPLPNTFYAKVTESWIDVGLFYMLTFIHEYGLYLLIVPIIFIISRGCDSEKRKVLSMLAIPFIPYLLYLTVIGGDHFEFRPLMVLIPVIALLIQEGIRAFHNRITSQFSGLARYITVCMLLIFFIFWTVPSYLSHINFPERYDSGIKVQTAKSGTIGSQIPLFSLYLRAFDHLHGEIAVYFVGLRQEEHKMAFDQVFYPQAMIMKEMVDKKYILPDEYISLWCVGTIPYYSGLPTIDYLGLTDAHIAHMNQPQLPGLPRKTAKLMAHEKRADWNYLRERKVVYISTRPATFFFPQEQFMSGGKLDSAKVRDGSFLVPLPENRFFVFSSTFIPEYFLMTLNSRGLDFFAKTSDKRLIYSPASSK
jgi:hypothetical protein